MNKKFLATMLLAFAVITGVAPYAMGASPQAMNAPAAGASLYTRLGGYDALVAVTKDFIGRLATDPQLCQVLHRSERHLESEGRGACH